MFKKTLTQKKVDLAILENFDVFRGRTFGEWTADWWNWVISADPAYWQDGPIHFLRPGFSRDDKGKTIFDSKVSSDTEVAYSDQAILLPVLNTMVDSKHFAYLDSPEKRRHEVRSDNDYSPHLQKKSFTIDDESLFDNNGKDWSSLRVESPEFILSVPDVAPGVSNKDLFDYPLNYPGDHRAVADGYWVFIQNLPKHGERYKIEWTSKGIHGYSTSAEYKIRVRDR
jgi:hypothetical protein